MSVEQGPDHEPGRPQPAPSEPNFYSALRTFSCIVVQALVGFGYQTKDFSKMGTTAQADIEGWFLHWTVLTNIYALFAMVVSFAPPYIRRRSRKMATLAFRMLLALWWSAASIVCYI